MKAELRRSIFLAGVGLLGGFTLVVTLYGASELFKHGFGNPEGRAVPLSTEPTPAPSPAEGGATGPGKLRSDRPPGPGRTPAPSSGDRADAPAGGSPQAGLEASAPTFDIIRVEPSGETVIAGRAAPNTTVEMLRDNQPVARVLVDPSGQFAIVPPALSAGSSEITLRSTGADGRTLVSRESVAVVVAPNRDAKPLIALTSPDKPTVVLSRPDPVVPTPPQAVAAAREENPRETRRDAGIAPRPDPAVDPRAVSNAAPKSTAKLTAKADPIPDSTAPPRAGGSGASEAAPAKPDAAPEGERAAGSPPVKIVSVEAEEGGRLYVTSQAQPGATVRLYLNDALVAPGSAGPDGRVAFTIGRGVQPGAYAIRVDQVDPVSGKVKARSEVAFTVPGPTPKPTATKPPATRPAPVASAAPPPAEPAPATPPARIAVLPPPQAADPPQARAGAPTPAMMPPAPKAGALAALAPEVSEPELSKPDVSKPDVVAPKVSDFRVSAPKAPDPAPVTEPGPAPGTPEGSRTVFVPEIGTARIVRGDSLWQISRRIYGRGTRYTVIYDANQPQIRNPDRIYPGQIFVVPADGTAAVTGAQRRG